MAFTGMSSGDIRAKIDDLQRLRAWLAHRNERHLRLAELIRDLSAELVWRHSRPSEMASDLPVGLPVVSDAAAIHHERASIAESSSCLREVSPICPAG
jgi:hypothetical protein